jgi:hypothetical protein
MAAKRKSSSESQIEKVFLAYGPGRNVFPGRIVFPGWIVFPIRV